MSRYYTGIHGTHVQKKYWSKTKQYNRFKPIIDLLLKKRYKHGLDFGCGTGALTILSGLYNIEIIGLDVYTWQDEQNNPFLYITKKMQKDGYPICIRDGGFSG